MADLKPARSAVTLCDPQNHWRYWFPEIIDYALRQLLPPFPWLVSVISFQQHYMSQLVSMEPEP